MKQGLSGGDLWLSRLSSPSTDSAVHTLGLPLLARPLAAWLAQPPAGPAGSAFPPCASSVRALGEQLAGEVLVAVAADFEPKLAHVQALLPRLEPLVRAMIAR